MRDFISAEAVKEAVISLLSSLVTASIGSAAVKSTAVSYTHLDVYKRQFQGLSLSHGIPAGRFRSFAGVLLQVLLCLSLIHISSRPLTTSGAYIGRKSVLYGS